MAIITATELTRLLESAGYENIRTDYSGRGMNGRQCVGVVIDHISELFALGRTIGLEEAESDWACPNPDTDSMGRGIIAYWPKVITTKA